MNPGIRRADVLGVGISAVDITIAQAEIPRWIQGRGHHHVCVIDVHDVIDSQCDPESCADVVHVAIEWPEFRLIDAAELRRVIE